MKSLKFFGKPKKPNPRRTELLVIRRVAGDSMLPALSAGRLVVGVVRFRHINEDDIVIVLHDGLEKIKRVAGIRGDRLFLVGDNAEKSTDSRSFGWLPVRQVRAKIVWPRVGRERVRANRPGPW